MQEINHDWEIPFPFSNDELVEKHGNDRSTVELSSWETYHETFIPDGFVVKVSFGGWADRLGKVETGEGEGLSVNPLGG